MNSGRALRTLATAVAVIGSMLIATTAQASSGLGISISKVTAMGYSHRAVVDTTPTDGASMVGKLAPYLVRQSDGTLLLTPPALVVSQVKPADLAATQHGIAILNTAIQYKGWQSTPDGLVYNPQDPSTIPVAAATAPNTTGGPYKYWWGEDWLLSSGDTETVVNALNAGVGPVGISALIPGLGELAIVTAGLMALGAGVLSQCNHDKRGVIIHSSYAGPVWCTSQ
jgi:hypothetical protein